MQSCEPSSAPIPPYWTIDAMLLAVYFVRPMPPVRDGGDHDATGWSAVKQGFAFVRHSYWESAEGTPRRALMQTLIGKLDF